MYDRILVPVDGSETSNLGLREAIRLGKLSGARLRVLHVSDFLSLPTGGQGYVGAVEDLVGAVRKAGEGILSRARAVVESEGLAVETALDENAGCRVCERVLDEAARWRADLIVLGTHGRRGVSRLMWGSDAEQIVRMATLPVLLVRDRRREN